MTRVSPSAARDLHLAVIPSAARDPHLRLRRGATTFLLLALVLAVPALARAQQEPSVRYGVTTSADTVTVGQPFEIRVRVRAPADADVRFPENPDSTGTVQGRDPRVIQVVDSVRSLDLIATYRVAAWDVGRQPVQLGDVVVTWQGEDRQVPLDRIEVFVRSVLPADSALRVPKPPRAIFETRPFPWWLLGLLLATIAIGIGVWWWMRRRRQPSPAILVDPYDRALRELSRIEALGLVDAGERTRFAALVVEVLRDYLAGRFPDASLALTSRELVALLRRQPTVPLELLSRVLHEADLAKFAAWTLSEERARTLARDARAIVDQEHEASRPAAAPPGAPDTQAAA